MPKKTTGKDKIQLGVFTYTANPDAFPLSVSAPIVIDPKTEAGVKPLVDFTASLMVHDNVDVAAKEAERLAPWFSALGVYIRNNLDHIAPEKRDTVGKLASPSTLSGIFNAMAKSTKTTLISDVAIIPDDIISGPAGVLFGADTFNQPYEYNGGTFTFGFLQVGDKLDPKKSTRSTTFPILAIDGGMMAAVRPHAPEAMLKKLQSMFTLVNHDMLHHLTLPVINPDVAARYTDFDAEGQVTDWSYNLADYEGWAQVSHEKIIQAGSEGHVQANIIADISGYFDELDKIGDRIAVTFGATRARAVVDFYGTVMAHTVSRAFSFNHPVMLHCLNEMERIDPAPDTVFDQLAYSMLGLPRAEEDWQDQLNSIFSKRRVPEVACAIIDGYKREGVSLLPPKDGGSYSYKQAKLLQLVQIAFEDVLPHVPNLTPEWQETAELTLDMIHAVATTTGHAEKPRVADCKVQPATQQVHTVR